MSKSKSLAISAGTKKLHSFGIKLPPIPTTTCGNLPKNFELSELRFKVSKGIPLQGDLDRREKLAMDGWLKEQTRLGLDVLVDSEMNRGDMINFFTNKISGFETGGTVRIYGNRYYRKPIIKSRLGWKEPLILPVWQNTQRSSNKPVKAHLTGPYTIMDWSFNDYYKSRAEICGDLVTIIRQELVSLIEGGAKIIQIDEPALSAQPDEFSLFSSSLRQLTAGLNAYFILWHGYGDIIPLWPKVERLPIDNIYLEAKNSNFEILQAIKKCPTKKDVTIGVIDSHQARIETEKEVEKSIRAALKVIPYSNLWIATDNGLKTRSTEEAIFKIDALVRSTKTIRDSLL